MASKRAIKRLASDCARGSCTNYLVKKMRLIVEYALRDFKKPIGVAQWQTKIVRSLPKELRGSLPTIEELEKELGGAEETEG